MTKRAYLTTVLSFAVSLGGIGMATPAQAQLQYGPWQKTNDCRTLRAPVGPGSSQIELPQVTVPGRERSMECRWERQVTECPRIRDRVRHPIQCYTKKQRSDYSVYSPG